MKKALITGIAGFVGSHLTSFLLSQKIQVEGLIHPKHKIQESLAQGVKLKVCDLLDKKKVASAVNSTNYDYVFHLAAFSSPAASFTSPQQTLKNNIFCQLNLLEALAGVKSAAKILIVGSSEEYGNIDSKYLPVNENAPLAPVSPYAVSKVAQDMLGYQFFLNKNLNIIRVRPFNHIGPGQSHAFVVSSFASKIAELEKKGGGTMSVGNLATFRDFTDVRDIVRAYFLALVKGELGEVYNIGSGKAYKIADILKKLVSFSDSEIKVVFDKKLLRQAEIEKIFCDFSKFHKATGWQARIPIDTSLFDTIKYERNKLSQSMKSKS